MSRNFPGVPKPLTINRNLPPLLDSQRRHGSNNRNNLPVPVIPCRRPAIPCRGCYRAGAGLVNHRSAPEGFRWRRGGCSGRGHD
jgi:hypothetical protein